MNFKQTIFLFFIILTIQLNSQSTNNLSGEPNKVYKCGTDIPPQAWDSWFNAKVLEFKENLAMQKTQATSVTIPVIVHVIHGGQSVGSFPNISKTQVYSQITALNKDFAGIGYNVNQLANTGFSTIGAANCLVSFCLAQSDPNGNPLTEPGIDRINYNSKGWTNPAIPTTNTTFKNLIDGTVKPNSIWDPTLYFNIWVTDINAANDLLGYATFPGGSLLPGISSSLGTANTDGVWCFARAFGTTGTLISGYNFGRTTTHEVGHWLGLRHIGGDALNSNGDCNATDYCDDTPPQVGGNAGGSNGQNFGNPTYPLNANVCGSIYGDMFMNFMDYTYDYAKYMFTPDQSLRIQTALANGFFRSQLNASSANLCSGRPTADFSIDSLVCTLDDVNILNLSEGFPIPTYSWSTSPSVGVVFTPSDTDANPKISYSGTGFYTVNVVITNSIGVSYAFYEQRVMDCTSLGKQSSFVSDLNIFPNPTDGNFTVKTNSKSGEVFRFSMVNTLGEVLFNSEASTDNRGEFSIDISSFPTGVYAFILEKNQEKISKRLILTH